MEIHIELNVKLCSLTKTYKEVIGGEEMKCDRSDVGGGGWTGDRG